MKMMNDHDYVLDILLPMFINKHKNKKSSTIKWRIEKNIGTTTSLT